MTAAPGLAAPRPRRRAAAAAAIVAAAFALAASAPALAGPYATRGSCAGWPRVALETPPGHCVALLADAVSGLRFPRRLLEVAPGRFWLVDMGSWEPRQGRLLEFLLPARGPAPIVFAVLAQQLDRPHGIARGPDGQIYVAEAGRIWRTRPGAPGAPATIEPVLDGLPADGAHPLKEIVFGAGGRLYLNVGSTTDACRDPDGRQPLPCPDGAGGRPRGAVWEAVLGGADFRLQSLRPYARGLRNSVALAFVAGPDVLLQGENSIDYVDAGAPPEELNVLREGGHYGWPYCVGAGTPARGYAGRYDCAKSVGPAMLWPAHAAPLQMSAVAADAPNRFAGHLVVAWHGYRAGGHRIVSFALGADGRPRGKPRAWIAGWDAVAGVRPLGAPTGFAIDATGRMLVVEDRHKTLLVLARDRP